MSLKNTKTPADEADRRIKHAVDILEIESELTKKPGSMSGGQRQRVAMAKAIVRNPSAFLMDEPLAALDAALRQSLRTELVALQKSLGTTTIFVTHDQVEAMTMGDMIVVMNDGRVEQVGSPDEIYNKPSTRFVAGFIGSPPMNFFDGDIGSENGTPVLTTSLGTFEIPERLRGGFDTRKVSGTLGVRPQNLKITTDPALNGIETVIFAIENLGKETIVVLHDHEDNSYRSIVGAAHEYTIGDRVLMVPDFEHAHLLAE